MTKQQESIYRDWAKTVLAKTENNPTQEIDLWTMIPEPIRMDEEIQWNAFEAEMEEEEEAQREFDLRQQSQSIYDYSAADGMAGEL